MKQPEGFSVVKMNRGSAICKKNKSNTQKTTMKRLQIVELFQNNKKL